MRETLSSTFCTKCHIKCEKTCRGFVNVSTKALRWTPNIKVNDGNYEERKKIIFLF